MEESHVSSASLEAVQSAEKLYKNIAKAVSLANSLYEVWLLFIPIPFFTIVRISVCNRIDACVRSDEFRALERLGPKIIPLLVFKLAKDVDLNSHGVFLYDILEKGPEYLAKSDEPVISDEILRRRASHIVGLNSQRNKIFEERVKAWKEHCQRNWLQSNTYVFTSCEQYFDLLEIGTSIIAHLMVEYSHNPHGYWYQLLHEIVHDRRLGAHAVQRGVLFEQCCQFFNEGEHDQAPKYIQSQLDREIMGDYD
ncbi:hypothetical protein HJFPF1_03935 [Paramyrothecium foliicola]|nr:hypothetical protein HJFPF1_03935 [Paramyrothecium foliicola]